MIFRYMLAAFVPYKIFFYIETDLDTLLFQQFYSFFWILVSYLLNPLALNIHKILIMAKTKRETRAKYIEMINVQCTNHKSTRSRGKFLKHCDGANVNRNEKGYYNNSSGFSNNNNGGMTAGGKLSTHLHIDEWHVINPPVDQSIRL